MDHNGTEHLECEDKVTEESLYKYMTLFYLIGFSTTIICVLFAIFIFVSIR